MTPYATLQDVREATKTPTASTTDDPVMLRNARTVSRRIDRLFESKRPYFAPFIDQLDFRLDMNRINSFDYTYRLPWPLLSLTGVTVGENALTLSTQVEAWPTFETPYRFLRLTAGDSWYGFSQNDYEPMQIKVTGIWGWHRAYADAWLAVTDLNGDIDDTVVTVNVTDAASEDAFGRTPGIAPGALIQVGTEWMEVTARATHALTVIRGVNGSTAAAHLDEAVVSVYQVEEDIRDVVARQAAFKYARRRAYENVTITDLGNMQFPTDLLHELHGVVAGYASL